MSSSTTEKFEFKAEIKQLLDILVHSLYTSREIFLRELISNSSDALDKLRFQLNKGTEVYQKDLPLEIRISLDKDKPQSGEYSKTITISDTGIGMTKEEIISNIGTIAKSGTSEFLKMLKENNVTANNIIGKFGVGFYSVFMVAKEVIIKTRSYRLDAKAVEWKSDGLGEYELKEIDEELPRGTKIEIKLKDDAHEFCEKYRIESIIKKHSNFISFPIYLENEKINTISAIWREPKSSISQNQYNEFYKFLTYDNEDPLFVIHKSVDAPIQFNSLLFIPKKSDEFFWFDRENYGLDLYVRRVLIQHKNKDLLPEYLSFVKGVVDSEDLPLNISRETLQENVIFSKISQNITSQVLNFLAETSKNSPSEYVTFWKEHGKIFKLGYTDFSNTDKFLELIRFNSSFNQNKDELTSLAEYVSRMKAEQKEIYYAVGQSREGIELDPHLELFKDKGLEVLYLYDPVDEIIVTSLRKYKDYEFKSVESVEPAKLEKFESQTDKEKIEELSGDDKMHFSSLLTKMKKILGDKVEDVKQSYRLTTSASCLVSKDGGLSSTMNKILRMTNKEFNPQKKIMEVNPNHKLIRNLLKLFKNNSDDKFIADVTEQLYESALLLEGNLDDPHKLVTRLNKMLEQASEWYLELHQVSQSNHNMSQGEKLN
ncbi:molecular chaperone HtpG [Melioribacteraceae bacterium 4301-Me]|uniref:molecular chaperone HtpG n=1 Tax=Pyranulibacter aquaticus TaxID=3163344 RepID=UPI003598127D